MQAGSHSRLTLVGVTIALHFTLVVQLYSISVVCVRLLSRMTFITT